MWTADDGSMWLHLNFPHYMGGMKTFEKPRDKPMFLFRIWIKLVRLPKATTDINILLRSMKLQLNFFN